MAYSSISPICFKLESIKIRPLTLKTVEQCRKSSELKTLNYIDVMCIDDKVYAFSLTVIL